MKKRFAFFSLLFVCSLFFAAFPVQAASLSGDGSSSQPYEITSAEDFFSLASMETSGQYFSLQNNLNLSGNTSIPMFSGILLGNGHSITGVTAPLFSTLSGGNIQDLAVTGGNVTGGILAKTMTQSQVSRCLVEGTVTSGGLVTQTMDETSVIANTAALGQVTTGTTGLFAGVNLGQVQDSYFAGRADGEISTAGVTSSAYDQTLLGRSVDGLTGLTTQAFTGGGAPLAGDWKQAFGAYPYPVAFASPPLACLPLTLGSGDSMGRISQNFSLPNVFSGQGVTWSWNGQPVSGNTDFAFPVDKTQEIVLTARWNGQSKRFALKLDREIRIQAVTETGSVYASGQKTNQSVTLTVTGSAPVEYALGGGSFQPYTAPFTVAERTEAVFRYAGETALRRFILDIMKQPPVIGGVTDGSTGYFGKQISFAGTGTLAKDGGAPQPFISGSLVKLPGVYELLVTDEYGNTQAADFTILPVAFEEITNPALLEQLRARLEDEFLESHGLPQAYLLEMQQTLTELQGWLDQMTAKQFDNLVASASKDADVEQLYDAYRLLSDEQRALLQNQAEYKRLVTALRSRRLTDQETGIYVVPQETLPLDVVIRVAKTKKGYRVWLERGGAVYEAPGGFTVKIPYGGEYLTLSAGSGGTYENGYFDIETDTLREMLTAANAAAAPAAKDQKEDASKSGGLLDIPNLGGWVIVVLLVGSMLLKIKRVDTE